MLVELFPYLSCFIAGSDVPIAGEAVSVAEGAAPVSDGVISATG